MANDRAARRRRILDAYAQTGSIRGTRRATGHSIGLIRKVLRGQDTTPKAPAKKTHKSKLDPYRPLLRRLVVEDRLRAVLVHEELRAAGFEGSYSTVKRAVHALRPSQRKRVTTRVEHAPGAEGQMDWSPYWVRFGTQRVRVHAFSLVLPFSRWMFVRFAMDETFETLIRLHDEAFMRIGAVPHVMSYDNMTTVGRHKGKNDVWINPRFTVYAGETDFDVRLTRPGRPNDHASVERPMHYIEHNCLRRRRFRFTDLESLTSKTSTGTPHGGAMKSPMCGFTAPRGSARSIAFGPSGSTSSRCLETGSNPSTRSPVTCSRTTAWLSTPTDTPPAAGCWRTPFCAWGQTRRPSTRGCAPSAAGGRAHLQHRRGRPRVGRQDPQAHRHPDR